jgi:squalene-hopene/tetraprenyl-beta-curcumene cyclase
MMSSSRVFLLSLVQGVVVFGLSAGAGGGENAPVGWDRTKAGVYLDGRGEAWFKFGAARRGQGATASSCVSCHSLLPYALARPVLRQISSESVPTELETRILEQTRRRVSNWDRLDSASIQLMYDFDDAKKKQSRGTEAVLNALLLARDDRFHDRREPSDDTKKALSILWATQIADGERKGSWEWINFGMEPWESDNSPYLGAALAAIAVSSAPGYLQASTCGDARRQIESLRAYLKRSFPSQNLHNRVWLLWASAGMDGLLTPRERDRLIEQILAKQQSDGGWRLAALGNFARKGAAKALSASDGYATGLVLHALQLAGLPKQNRQISTGLAWLRSNQDPTGAWRAMSVNKNRSPESKEPAKAHVGKFMWDAATGYAVLALGH